MTSIPRLERTTFETSRTLEYFTKKELQLQLGHEETLWPLTICKELIDNALDACETAEVAPVVTVRVDDNGFEISDNGPGIPPEVVERSLDYLVRVSDKAYYVAPTRGQLGNALKAIYAAPFVMFEEGTVEVEARGVLHVTRLSLDRIAQRPVLDYQTTPGAVRTGTRVRVSWRNSACLLGDTRGAVLQPPDWDPDDYWDPPASLLSILEGYAAFNPHATLIWDDVRLEPTNLAWSKWRPGDPTSPHWYTPETLRDLIAAYVSAEQRGEPARTVREFVSEFRGLTATAKQKEIGRQGIYLHDLVVDGDIDQERIAELLGDMRRLSQPPSPRKLGVIGKEHLSAWMAWHCNVAPTSVRYACKMSIEDDLPHVVEVALGIRDDEDPRRVLSGLNWSPTLDVPIPQLNHLLQESRIDMRDPVTVVFHIARPRFEFVDRSKSGVRI